jgi:hypothetical protein
VPSPCSFVPPCSRTIPPADSLPNQRRGRAGKAFDVASVLCREAQELAPGGVLLCSDGAGQVLAGSFLLGPAPCGHQLLALRLYGSVMTAEDVFGAGALDSDPTSAGALAVRVDCPCGWTARAGGPLACRLFLGGVLAVRLQTTGGCGIGMLTLATRTTTHRG